MIKKTLVTEEEDLPKKNQVGSIVFFLNFRNFRLDQTIRSKSNISTHARQSKLGEYALVTQALQTKDTNVTQRCLRVLILSSAFRGPFR